MKHFEKPEIKIDAFECEDVLTASNEQSNPGHENMGDLM